MSQGTHLRAPFSVKLPDGTIVEIVDSEGVIQDVQTIAALVDDTRLETDKKVEFRSADQFIHSPSAGKLAITATIAGADDITLTGGTTLVGTLAVSGAVALAAAVTMATDKKVIFRSSGIYIHSSAVGKLLIAADGAGADDITLSGAVTLDDNISIPTSKKVIFRSTGIYINSPSAGKLSIVADGAGADDITLSGGVTIAGSVAATGTHTQTGAIISSLGVQTTATARTATADGTSTGAIATNTGHVTVTCDDANKIIVLPAPTPGRRVILVNGATGYELRTSDPATIGINGGVGSAAESAIPANSTVYMTCASATAWVGFYQIADGTIAKVEVAAP